MTNRTSSISSQERSTGLIPNPRLEAVQEATWSEIELTLSQQSQLLAIGKRLAKGTDRYGEVIPGSDASLIRIERGSGREARIRVADAVGVVSIPGLQLLVKPKIPQDHLLYLARSADVLPAMESHRAAIKQDQHLAHLIAYWFIAALEKLLEEGLSPDYRLSRDRLDTVRGRINLVRTARMFYKGQPSVFSEFEEFDFDTPLNRMLLAAARVVASGEALPPQLRRRAIRATRLLDGVGRLGAADMMAEVDRTTAHYFDGVALAREIIDSSGRALEAGESPGWTFLFRTARPVEFGLRRILKEALRDQVKVAKRAFPLIGSSKVVNPDLVFGDVCAIGDVKYKMRDGDWNRPDLYEVVAFAEAARVTDALLIDFQVPTSPRPQAISVGKIRVHGVSWLAHETIDPAQAAGLLSAEVRKWASTLPKRLK